MTVLTIIGCMPNFLLLGSIICVPGALYPSSSGVYLVIVSSALLYIDLNSVYLNYIEYYTMVSINIMLMQANQDHNISHYE